MIFLFSLRIGMFVQINFSMNTLNTVNLAVVVAQAQQRVEQLKLGYLRLQTVSFHPESTQSLPKIGDSHPYKATAIAWFWYFGITGMTLSKYQNTIIHICQNTKICQFTSIHHLWRWSDAPTLRHRGSAPALMKVPGSCWMAESHPSQKLGETFRTRIIGCWNMLKYIYIC